MTLSRALRMGLSVWLLVSCFVAGMLMLFLGGAAALDPQGLLYGTQGSSALLGRVVTQQDIDAFNYLAEVFATIFWGSLTVGGSVGMAVFTNSYRVTREYVSRVMNAGIRRFINPNTGYLRIPASSLEKVTDRQTLIGKVKEALSEQEDGRRLFRVDDRFYAYVSTPFDPKRPKGLDDKNDYLVLLEQHHIEGLDGDMIELGDTSMAY